MNRVFNNICPVCGYDELEDGTDIGEICSSCGTEFGYNDFEKTYVELRQLWISENNAQWWSEHTPAPLGWSPVSQLRNIAYVCTQADLEKISLPEPTCFIAWMGTPTVGTTRAYVPCVVSTHNDMVALAIPIMQVKNMNQTASNLDCSTGLLSCLSS